MFGYSEVPRAGTDRLDEAILLHNPRCSKSRETLALLEARGEAVRVVNYLDTPPERALIEQLIDRLGLEPRGLMRTQELLYAGLGLDDPALTHAQLVDALHAHPQLLQRPILVANGKAAIGRPPEAVLAIL